MANDGTISFPTGSTSPEDRLNFLPLPPSICGETEELFPKEEITDFSTKDIIVVSVRCVIAFLCLIGTILVIVVTARSRQQRYKSWRLYILTSLLVLAWMCMSLYRDYIDLFWIQEIYRIPIRYTIYQCIQNLIQGLSLYVTVLLLSHLSDFQHRGSWLWLIAMVILVPLVYSVVLLVVQLNLPHEGCTFFDETGEPIESEFTRESFVVTTTAETIKVAFYNVATTILLLVFSRKLCTRRLYGTYSEQRSPLVVLMSRWTFAFLILHNLTAIAAYSAYIAAKDEVCKTLYNDGCADVVVDVKNILDEVLLFLIVLAVPGSYLIASLCQCCCGLDSDQNSLEMEKIDKVYQEVWTPTAGSTTTQIQNQPLPQPGAAPAVSRNAMPSSNPGGGNPRNGSHAASGPNSRTGSQATLTSIDSLGELPSVSRRPQSRQKNRESYMEAMSMGSFDETGSDRYSVTTDPVDL